MASVPDETTAAPSAAPAPTAAPTTAPATESAPPSAATTAPTTGTETAATAVATASAWLEAHPYVSGADRKAWLEQLVDAGWAAPSWPADEFGRGLALRVARATDQVFRSAGLTGWGQDVTNLWAATIIAWARPDLKRAVLRDLLLGQINMCLLYSEPGAGSDLASVQTKIERDGDEWVVNGQKVWTSSGRDADYAFLIGRTDPSQPKHRGITFFFLPMDQPGVQVRPLRQATGDSRFNEVFMTDARVPDANMLGEYNHGWRVLTSALAYERSAMGVARTRPSTSDESAKATRDPSSEAEAPVPDLSLIDLATDRGVIDDPTIRQDLMRLHAWRTLNSWNNQRAKAELSKGTSSPVVSLGKLAMSRMLHFGGSLQARILGSEAMLAGNDFHHAADATYSMLNAFFTSIGGGTDQIQRNIIGERILGLPKEPAVDKDLPFSEVRVS